MLNRSGSDREFLKILFDASLPQNMGNMVFVFVHQSSHDDCHEIAPS